MRAGGLRDRLQPLELVKGRDPDTGEKWQRWEEHPNIRADRAKMSGRRQSGQGENTTAYDAEYRVRIKQTVSDGWRIRTPEGLTFEVVATDRDERKQMKTLKCRKVDEGL